MKLKIFNDGNAFSLTSSLSKKDYDLVQKHQPEALTLKDKDDNEIFRLSYEKGNPYVGPKAVSFSGTNKEGFLVLTGKYPEGSKEPKEDIADIVGAALKSLTKLEADLPAVVTTIKGERAALIEGIEEV